MVLTILLVILILALFGGLAPSGAYGGRAWYGTGWYGGGGIGLILLILVVLMLSGHRF